MYLFILIYIFYFIYKKIILKSNKVMKYENNFAKLEKIHFDI